MKSLPGLDTPTDVGTKQGFSALLLIGTLMLANNATVRAAELPSRTAQTQAPFELAGYWVSLVTQDWRYRMVVPGNGEFGGIPLNHSAEKFSDNFNAETDDAAGKACEAYGAPALMRIPERLHITWPDNNTLRVDTDSGTQTRLLRFEKEAGKGAPSIQGNSQATWLPYAPSMMLGIPGAPGEQPDPALGAPPGGMPLGPPPGAAAGGPPGAPPGGAMPGASAGAPPGGLPGGGQRNGPGRPGPAAGAAPKWGTLKVLTTDLLPGLLRKNGVPYSNQATLTEYWKVLRVAPDLEYLSITSIVSDPVYLTRDYTTTPIFMREPDGSKWHPAACTLRSAN